MWVDKITSLHDFRTGWFLDVLTLDSYLLSTQASLGHKLRFRALPRAVGNVWIRLQKSWAFIEFYTLRNLSQIWSSVFKSCSVVFCWFSPPSLFSPSCRVTAWFNTYYFDSLALSCGKTRHRTSQDIRCKIFKDLSFLLCLSNVCWNFCYFFHLGTTAFSKVSLLVTRPF